MEKVLDVYKKPYDEDFQVVCMDESPKQLIEEGKPTLPIKPGQDARVDYEYVRHGVVNIFMANEPLKGRRLVEVTEFKTRKEWAKFIKKIANEMYPNAQKIILVMDNFKTHAASAFYETFEPTEAKRLWDRFEFVYTPKHGQCLNRHIATMDKVVEEVAAWQENRNNKNSKINWQFTNTDARIKLKRLYPSLQD